MATPQEAQREQEEFAAAFAEPEPERKEMSEDEAFGLSESARSEELGEPVDKPVADAASTEGAEVSSGDEATPTVAIVVEPSADDGAAIPADDQGDEPTDPKDVQRKKSWEGRLKAREAELKAREDALASKHGAQADADDEGAEPKVTTEAEAKKDIESAATPKEAVEEAAEAVEEGALTPEQAMAFIASDFGEEFAKMLGVLIDHKATEIAGKMADEKVGGVRKDLDSVVDDIVTHRMSNHIETIADKHEDFLDVAKSAEFKDWVESLPDEYKQRAMQVIQGGTARQIIKLLDLYKKDAQQPEPQAEPQPDEGKADPAKVDAAEGVRSSSSGAMSLPDKPARDNSYEEAWAQF